MAAFSKELDVAPRWQLKLEYEYEYEVVYKAGKINANADAFSRNPILILSLKASGKTDPKEPLFLRRSLRNKFPKGSTAIDSRLEETQPDINIQPTKTNNDTENKRNESSSKDINNDLKIDSNHRSLFFIHRRLSCLLTIRCAIWIQDRSEYN